MVDCSVNSPPVSLKRNPTNFLISTTSPMELYKHAHVEFHRLRNKVWLFPVSVRVSIYYAVSLDSMGFICMHAYWSKTRTNKCIQRWKDSDGKMLGYVSFNVFLRIASEGGGAYSKECLHGRRKYFNDREVRDLVGVAWGTIRRGVGRVSSLPWKMLKAAMISALLRKKLHCPRTITSKTWCFPISLRQEGA